MRDYTRVYIIGLSLLCLILIIVVATVPAHKSYIDDVVKSISANVSRQANADSTAAVAVLKRLTTLETQQKDAQEKLSLLRKDTSSVNATTADFAARLTVLNNQVIDLGSRLDALNKTLGQMFQLVSDKPDKSQFDYIRTQMDGISSTQSALMNSIQYLYKYLHLAATSGNSTGH